MTNTSRQSQIRALQLATLACSVFAFSKAEAAVIVGGHPNQVSPADPSTWTAAQQAQVGIGYGKTGTVTVNGGSTITSWFGSIGYYEGSVGHVTIAQPGSAWSVIESLNVGNLGIGSLDIQDGGQVSSKVTFIAGHPGSTGMATVAGTGSYWSNTTGFYVGNAGNGSLQIRGGGAAITAGAIVGRDVAATGTVSVADAGSLWTTTNTLWVGEQGHGILTVANGGKAVSPAAYIGSQDGSLGEVTVSGVQSRWENGGALTLGWGAAAGYLTIEQGGTVRTSSASVGWGINSVGEVTVRGQSSAWENASYLHVASQGRGTLRIVDGGTVTTGTLQIGGISTASGEVSVSGSGSRLVASGVGIDHGLLTVQHGGVVSGGWGSLGMNNGSVGRAVVTGPGSAWENSGNLQVGSSTTGLLLIERGGRVTSAGGELGGFGGGTGRVTVIGEGSTWANSDTLSLGRFGGAGHLIIGRGATVSANNIVVESGSSVDMHVSRDGMLVLGDSLAAGNVQNSGTIRFSADAFLPAGVYRPITDTQGRAMVWAGAGQFQAVGGAWNATSKVFQVASAQDLPDGASTTLVSGQRMVIASTDGQRVGASFGAIAGSAHFSASSMSGVATDAIPTDGEDQVLSAWNFVTDLPAGSEVLLSFEIDPNAGNLQAWHYDGIAWSLLGSDCVLSSSGIASIVVADFSAYAITGAVVPEPATVGVFGMLGCISLLRRRAVSLGSRAG